MKQYSTVALFLPWKTPAKAMFTIEVSEIPALFWTSELSWLKREITAFNEEL